MSALPYDPLVPGSYERFQGGVDAIVEAAFFAAPLVPRAAAAAGVVSTAYEAYKKFREWIRHRPNRAWEDKNKVMLSSEIPKMPDRILDELLLVAVSYHVNTTLFIDAKLKLDEVFINLGPLFKRETIIIRGAVLLTIAQNCEHKCSHCSEPIRLKDIYAYREIVLRLADQLCEPDEINVLCQRCRRDWIQLVEEAAYKVLRVEKWRRSPLVNRHSSSDERCSAIKKVVRYREKLATGRRFGAAKVEYFLRNYPTAANMKRKIERDDDKDQVIAELQAEEQKDQHQLSN